MKVARIKLGRTQQEVADHIGVTQATYSRIEHGLIRPDEEKLEQLAELLDVEKDELLTEDDLSRDHSRGQNIREQASLTLDPIDIPAMLRDLKELLDDGIITEEEFDNKKRDLLARL